jgi:plastocyanin
VADGWTGVDPYADAYPTSGPITHGPLAENRNHGGAVTGLPNPLRLLSGNNQGSRKVAIDDFVYGQGDLSAVGRASRLPVVRPGQPLTFINNDAFDANRLMDPKTIYHTITACKNPCNRATGVAYPLADAKVPFDSGELGYGPYGNAAQRKTWSTPKNLKAGTYSYFCRIHPFMRGAFRVVKLKGT